MNIEYVDINELKANPKNPRKISESDLNKLVASMREFGFVQPILVNKNPDRYNIIIGGHQRIEAAKRIGMTSIPVIYADYDETKENLLNIALNKIGGEFDEEKLATLFRELEDEEISLTGFDEHEIDGILEASDKLEQDSLIDIAPELPKQAISKLGELWILGKHRLVCGDSTKPETFELLMDGKKADMILTDPPYGVSYKGTNNPNGKPWGVMDNDELRGDVLYQFLSAIYSNASNHSKEDTALYTFYASINHMIFEKGLNEGGGFIIKQQLIWEKGHVLGHSDYHWSHEPILYCRKKENCEFYGDRTHKTILNSNDGPNLKDLSKEALIDLLAKIRENSDILKVSKGNVMDYVHPTQKPVELLVTLIKNSSKPGEIVLEPCAGSGSTIIASEKANRSCYAIELDPRYVDVILDRYLISTGIAPVRSDGSTWKELKEINHE